MQNSSVYYPLTAGNYWTYSISTGGAFTNKVVEQLEPGLFMLNNSMTGQSSRMKKEGDMYLTDSHEAGTLQVILKEDGKPGDSWQVKFKANGFDNILVMTIKELISSKKIGDKTFSDVILIEAESKMVVNGNTMALNFFTQYYYAKGIGLILTTTSAGDNMSLVSYEINN